MADHKAAKEGATKRLEIKYGAPSHRNLAEAYLELRELAKEILDNPDSPCQVTLRKALEDSNESR